MEDALKRVEKLFSLNFSYDIPSSTSEPVSLSYRANFDTNFRDSAAFAFGLSKFWEEAKTLHIQTQLVNEGQNTHASTFYTWRSLNIPLTSLPDDHPQKAEINLQVIQIMESEMVKLFDLYKFVELAVHQFVTMVTKECKTDTQFEGFSEAILMGLGKMLDMLSVLDDLRSAKTSIKNDLSAYKRLKTIAKTDTPQDPEILELVKNLTTFLALPNQILNSIKKGLEGVPESYKVIGSIIAIYCNYIENRFFISPEQRYAPYRIIQACLFLIAGEKNLNSKLDQLKAPLSRIDKVTREMPIIPLIGDMHSSVAVTLKRLNIQFDWKLLDSAFVSKLNPLYNILLCSDTFMNEHIQILTEMTLILNSDKLRGTCNGAYEIPPNIATAIFNFAVKALKFCGKWNYALQDMLFYKLSHPADPKVVFKESREVDNYSLATMYNYSPQEKSVISRIIYFIKSLCDLLGTVETLFFNAISMHIYSRVQEFSNNVLQTVSKKSEKSKNPLFKTIVWSIRTIACDRVGSSDPKAKKDQKHSIHSKAVSPLSSQIYMIQTMVHALMSMKEFKKSVDATINQQMGAFMNELVYFREVSDFSAIRHGVAQTSSFWFKEFYIEMAGKNKQYPINDSFPYIMINHMVNHSSESNMHDYILRTTAVYGDAAHYALNKLKRRHLFDEIDAEYKLVYDQICFLVATRLFTSVRAEAFTIMIDKSLKTHILKRLLAVDRSYFGENTVPYHVTSQLSSLCKQRSIHYLTRTIDLKALTSQRLLARFKHSVTALFNYMESGGLEHIVMIYALLDVYKEVHRILTRNFDLPPFQIILRDIDGNMPGFMSRISNYVLTCIRTELACDYSYCLETSRFIKSPTVYTGQAKAAKPRGGMEVYPSKYILKAFEDIYCVYSGFIGIEHFEVLFKLVGYGGMSLIFEEIKKDLAILATNELKDYTGVLLKGMPSKCTSPRAAYGVAGALQYYNANFDQIIKYPDLRCGVLHCFRTFGNYLMIAYLAEKAAYAREESTIYLTSAMSGLVSYAPLPENTKVADTLNSLMEFYRFFNLDNIPFPQQDETFQSLLQKSHVFNKEKLCCGLSPFAKLLEDISQVFNTHFWHGPEPLNGAIAIDECTDFHSVYSALSYCAIMDNSSANPVEHEFGDGVHVTGQTIIAILKQNHRFEALDFNTNIVSISEIETGSAISTISFSSVNCLV